MILVHADLERNIKSVAEDRRSPINTVNRRIVFLVMHNDVSLLFLKIKTQSS